MNRRTVTLASLIGYFFIGCIPIMLAPALPALIKEFRLTLATAGAVFVARSAGQFAGVLLGGVLSDRFGRKPLLIGGCLLQGLMTGLAGIAPNWLAITLALGLAGLGVGLINPTVNAVVAETNADRRGAAINALHGVYSVGAMAGPIIAGYLLTAAYGWRYVFFGGSLIWVLYALALLGIAFPAPPAAVRRQTAASPAPSAAPRTRMTALLANPLLLLLFSVSFLYNGTATSLVSWINTYLAATRFPLLLGAGMVSIFYFGLAAGRFICSALADRVGYARVILICAVGSLVFYPVAIYLDQPLLIALGVLGAGAFLAGLHPTGMAWATREHPEMGGTIASFLSIAMTLGAMSVPWLTGLIADWIGFRLSFGLNILLLLVLVVLAAGLVIRPQRAGTASKLE